MRKLDLTLLKRIVLIARPYWVSEHKWRAWGLLALLFLLLIGYTWSNVRLTQRGVKESDADYRAVADPATRISLFVRSTPRDEFTYLGEMRHRSHRQFTAADGRSQIQFLFELLCAVPETVRAGLYAAVRRSSIVAGPRSGSKDPVSSPTTRRPTTLGETREALAYALGTVQRVINPAHHNYQVRLHKFLTELGVEVEFEPDFIDVRMTSAVSNSSGRSRSRPLSLQTRRSVRHLGRFSSTHTCSTTPHLVC